MLRLQHLITTLNLQPHPEGGFFAETYRSALLVDTPTGPRPASTAIYFLLTPGSFSAFHRIAFDECWHHYEGDPVHIHVLHTQGRYEQLALGPLNHVGQAPQAMVPGGAWFASHLAPPAGPPAAGYALVGCTVAPGFCFEDFELAERAALQEAYPAQAALIERLTRI